MSKKFYIIPGWEETCRRKQYQNLATAVRKKDYEVVFVKVDWKRKLSKQFFDVEDDSTTFGFSLGAILARLVVQKQKCNHMIAELTPQLHKRKTCGVK